MKSRTFASLLVVVVLSMAAYWYWSPLLALKQMQRAAEVGDADALNERVDYPKLRESIKGQLTVLFTEHLTQQPAATNDFAKAGAALGTVLGLAMVDRMVDAFVRPEVVMRAMQEGKVTPKSGPRKEPGLSRSERTSEAVWSSERKGSDKYVAYVMQSGEPPDRRVGLVLERSGFANWKLTEIRLPALQ